MLRLNTLYKLRLVYLLVGTMFFYGIEQLFLDRYVHTNSARGYATITFAVGLVAFDVPTGILADKIGRKVCMIASTLVTIVSLAVLGSSTSLSGYLIGTVLFSLQMCLFNGAVQAFLHSHLAQEGKATLYAKYQGSMYAWWLSGAGIANLASGLIAHEWSLRSAYFASIIPPILALAILTRLREPVFEKSSEAAWYTHAGAAFKALSSNKALIRSALFAVAATITLLTIGEFGQIYFLHFGVSTVMLGILWAIDALFAAGGRGSAHLLQKHPNMLIGLFCCLLLALGVLGNFAIGIGIYWILYGCNEAVANAAESETQAHTPDHMRATMLSLVNCIGNLIAIPMVLLYTNYNAHHGIISANRALTIGIALFLVIVVILFRKQPTTPSTEMATSETLLQRQI